MRPCRAIHVQRGDIADALGAVGEVHRLVQVVHEDADDLAEAQGDDRQVIAAQLEHRRADQHPADGCGHRRQWDDHPHRPVQHALDQASQLQVRRSEQGVQVGADGVEADVAHVKQAGVADDDVQAQRQQHVEHGEAKDAYPGRAKHRDGFDQERQGDETEDQQQVLALEVLHGCLLTPGRPGVRQAGRSGAAAAPGSARRRRRCPDSWRRGSRR
ncbi:hypothetical protein D9M71_518680 [compost metagenome]